MFNIVESVTKPDRSGGAFPFKDIPVGGGLLVVPTEGEEFDKLAMKVRNSVASFKKANKTYKLSVFTLAKNQELKINEESVSSEIETVLVYRNPDKE